MNPSSRTVSPPPVPPTTRPRVLIADDCSGTRNVVAHMLCADYEPILFEDGSSAWDRIQGDASIAALVTDLDMPGLDGYELIAKIRGSNEARLRNMPIIAITGAADQETRRRVFVSGATGLVMKPINRDQLLDLARAYVHAAPEEFRTPAVSGVDNAVIEASSAPKQVSRQLESIEFNNKPAHADTPAPTASTVADPINALSVSALEHIIRQDIGATPRPTPDIPAELIGIDAALQSIHAGHGDLLIPYLPYLEQRLQPFLSRYRQHFGHDIGAD